MILMTARPSMMRFMKLNKAERMSISQLGDLISIRKVGIDASDMKISGAGIWHTQLHLQVTKLVAVDLTSFTKTTMLNLAMSIFLPTFVHAMVKMLSTRPFLERQEEFSYSRYLGRTF